MPVEVKQANTWQVPDRRPIIILSPSPSQIEMCDTK